MRRLGIPLSLILILVSSFASNAAWRSTADSLYAAAEELHSVGSYEDAAELYAKAGEAIGPQGDASGLYFQSLGIRSRFMAARSLELAGRYGEALRSYEEALPDLAEIRDLVLIRLAACHRELGHHEEALGVLREVTDDGEEGIFDLIAVEAIADSYLDSGENDLAVQWCRMLLSEVVGYNERARAGLKLARAQRARGDDCAALSSYAAVVDNFPRSPHAYEAMHEARMMSRAFTSRYSQGLVLYNRQRYREAQEFFAYYLRHDDAREHRTEATYFLGRSYQRLGNYGAAAAKYEDVIAAGPESEYYDLTWPRLAYCLRVSGDDVAALETYDRFVALHPDSPESPNVLWEKSRFLEEDRRWSEAVVSYRALSQLYSSSSRAADARFRAGLCLYKSGDLHGAQAAFADLSAGDTGDRAARALFWSGKTMSALGREADAVELYRMAADASTDSYYSFRAREALGDGGTSSGGEVARAEALDFATWLGRWYEEVYFPNGRILLRQQLSADPVFVRADLLLGLHMRDLAEREFDRLEDAVGTDPRMLDVLIAYYERVGLNKRAIGLAERILSMSPEIEIGEAPVYLRRRICPTPFTTDVRRECFRNGIDPAVFFSLMRQESLFEPEAVSWVGARGLSQIMPATGRWLARRLGERGYSTGRLLDPDVNIRFGTYYLADLIEGFDGDVLRALAAYNGGPENVERWWDYSGLEDTDVFVEDIGYPETADYVRRVYRYAGIYRDIGVAARGGRGGL